MPGNTLSALVKEISDAMVKEGEARAPFQLRDIRRTCETMLAGLKVSKDVRSHLLSHGLGGVQDQHYSETNLMPWSSQTGKSKGDWSALFQIETYRSMLPVSATIPTSARTSCYFDSTGAGNLRTMTRSTTARR